MTTYIGQRSRSGGGASVSRRSHDGAVWGLPLRRNLVNHSYDPEWGYGGSGPAQLALALLVDATGDEAWSLAHYQRFKWDVVAKLPWEWEMPKEKVLEWIEAEKRKDADEAHWVRTGEPPVP